MVVHNVEITIKFSLESFIKKEKEILLKIVTGIIFNYFFKF